MKTSFTKEKNLSSLANCGVEENKQIEKTKEEKLIDSDIKKDCYELILLLRDCDNEELLCNNLSLIRDFYKKYHQGNDYYVEEIVIFHQLNNLMNWCLNKKFNTVIKMINNIQTEVLNLTSENKDKELNRLLSYWNKLVTLALTFENSIVQYDFGKITLYLYRKYFEPLIYLIYSTQNYFMNKKSGGVNKFTHDELSLINYIFKSFLSHVDYKIERQYLNEFYYALHLLLKEIVDDNDEYYECMIAFGDYHFCDDEKIFPFKTVEQFARDSLFHFEQLIPYNDWEVEALDFEKYNEEYTSEDFEKFKNESLDYLEKWSREY